MAIASANGSDTLTRWRLEELLLRQPGLRIVPAGSGLVLAGTLEVNAQVLGKAAIRDRYQIELRIPPNFSRKVPLVFETGGRIPRSYHQLQDGSLCLGSETRLRLLLTEGLSLVGFVERCVVPYLYRYSYLKTYGEAPFGDLAHGADGIREDLRLLFGVDRDSAVLPFVCLVAMRKRQANKRACPCGSGRRLGRCHNRPVNRLRDRLGRYWFRIVEQQLRRG
jgi:SEC-C motif-containing protein